MDSENADNGESDAQFKSRVIVRQFDEYPVIETPPAPNASGNAFHLATDEIGTNQSITFPDAYVISENSQLTFRSMVRAATDSQIAKVNVSLDNGVSWLNVFSQTGQTPQGSGNGSTDEDTFTFKRLICQVSKVEQSTFSLLLTIPAALPLQGLTHLLAGISTRSS